MITRFGAWAALVWGMLGRPAVVRVLTRLLVVPVVVVLAAGVWLAGTTGWGIALLAAVVLGGGLGALVIRGHRLADATVQTAAMDIAEQVLPELLVAARDGRSEVVLPPVPPGFGPLAKAFELACAQAVDAATEQATMRMGYYAVFVNMFRRSQTLLQRQLRLIVELERDERANERLDKLYELDHLVTRMRRNNENVLILSGTELVRKAAKPLPLASVFQAALSEIDQYQRVEVADSPAAKIIDSAASDLIRLLAELLDNATAFSAPHTKVTVEAQVLRDGTLTITATDRGIGMSDEQITAANERLTRLSSADLAKSRRVGLLVVGRLAGRQGLAVELLGGSDRAGVTALVSVPATLVVEAERPGWADRRHAMNAAAARRKQARQTARPKVPAPVGPVRTVARTLAAAGSPAAGAVAQAVRTEQPELFQELVKQAHADVPADLPVRTPNKLIGKAAVRDRAERVEPGWFRASGTAATDWWSAADSGWQRAAAVRGAEQAEYAEYTEEGLPRRKPGAWLLPGSARGVDTTVRPIQRDPERVRLRLGAFQQAVSRVRPRRATGWQSMGSKR